MKKNTLYMIYGKLDPVHLGHYKMFLYGASFVDHEDDFIIHVTGNTKIPHDIKCQMILDYYPAIKPYLCKDIISTIFEAIQNASAEYDNLILICGDDRKDEFQKILDDYSGKFWDFKSARTVSVGDRDNKFSSTNLREAISTDNFDEYCTFMPELTIGMWPVITDELNIKYFNLLKEYV